MKKKETKTVNDGLIDLYLDLKIRKQDKVINI